MISITYSNHPNLDDLSHFSLFLKREASLKYDGIHVSRVYDPQLLQKCAIIIAHTAGDVIICNHGVGSCVNNYYASSHI